MRIVTKPEFEIGKLAFFQEMVKGALFIYPTDTIYGIGCDATNSDAVKQLRDLKSRHKAPFSVIAPSKKWIEDTCEFDSMHQTWLKKLPGPYTLILKLKNKEAIASGVTNGLDTLGVRIPDHWFSKVVDEFGRPIVTTSANFMGGDYMTSIDDLDPEIKMKVKFIIDEGEKKGRPSALVDLTKDELDIRKR